MKKTALYAIALIAIMLSAGCASTSETQRKYKNKFTKKPTVIIKTTQGEIRVVIFPGAEEPRFCENFICFFADKAVKGYYNGAILPVNGRGNTYEALVFNRVIQSRSEHVIKTQKLLNIQPTRGTLYYDNKNTAADLDMPHVIVSHFSIVTKTSQDFGYPKEIMLPSAGTTYCVGQVIEGMDVLEKLAAKNRAENKNKQFPVDKVISITEGPKYEMSAQKYVDLCNGKITTFDEVLKDKK